MVLGGRMTSHDGCLGRGMTDGNFLWTMGGFLRITPVFITSLFLFMTAWQSAGHPA